MTSPYKAVYAKHQVVWLHIRAASAHGHYFTKPSTHHKATDRDNTWDWEQKFGSQARSAPFWWKPFSISEISDMSNSRGIHLLSNSCPIHRTGIWEREESHKSKSGWHISKDIRLILHAVNVQGWFPQLPRASRNCFLSLRTKKTGKVRSKFKITIKESTQILLFELVLSSKRYPRSNRNTCLHVCAVDGITFPQILVYKCTCFLRMIDVEQQRHLLYTSTSCEHEKNSYWW